MSALVYILMPDQVRLAADTIYRDGIDIVFSDFSHGPDMVMELVARFLPKLAPVGSIFIDSASTHRVSYVVLERIVDALNARRVPAEMVAMVGEEGAEQIDRRMRLGTLQLVRLVETHNRPQNSTAWLRFEPFGMSPALANNMHG